MRISHPGFLLTIPQKLISGRNQLVCVTIHDALPPARIRIDLKYKEEHYYTDKIIEFGYSCLEMKVPVHDKKSPQYVSLKVQMLIEGIVYGTHNMDPILVYPDKKHTFISLDRTAYKPGDKIKIRILLLNEDLLPPEQQKIPEVRIRNPSDVSVAVWENVSTTLGLVQLEHQIYKDALLGKWRVEVNGETKHFDVSKYVLPRFSLKLDYPKIIYFGTKLLELKVCSAYTFGQEVKGKAFIKITDTHGNMKPFYEIDEMTSGCANFKITKENLGLDTIKRKYSLFDPKIQLQITATVIEYGTDKIEVENIKIPIDWKEYHLKFISENTFYPGLPYYGKIQLTNIHTTVKKDVVEICYNVAIKKSWNYLNNEQCSNFTVGSENMINFSILPLKNSVIHVRLTARSLNHTTISDTLLVARMFSLSNDYIVLKTNNNLNKQCGAIQQLLVIYTTDRLRKQDNVTFYSMVKSKGQLHSVNKLTKKIQPKVANYKSELKNIIGTTHKYHTDGSSFDKFVLKFNLDEKIIWKYRILIYYVTLNGEMIVATKEIDRGPCMRNKVQAYWSNPKLHPAQRATLNVKTSSTSLCAISAVDASVEFMGASGNLNLNSVLKNFFTEAPLVESNRKTCVAQQNRRITVVPSFYTDPNVEERPGRRKKRYIYPFAEDYDAYDIFNKFGTVVISNLKVVTKNCYNGPKVSLYNPAPFQTDHYNLQNEDITVIVRTYFPETWIWELTPVRNYKQIDRELPHSITKWSTNVLCVSKTEGVGFAPVSEMISYQPFFVNILTPFSIKRGETMHLRILVFNYMAHSLPIKIAISNSNGLKLLTSHHTASYCIIPRETITHVFPLVGNDVGDATVTIFAEIDPFFPGYCGPETIVNVRDVMVKHLQIEPEGYPIENTKSMLLCNSDIYTSNNVSWHISVPTNVVPNTAKAKLSLNADLLSEAIENLEDLLQIPNGCGEQIMATMAPNLYVLKYLQSINNLEASVRQRAVKNMKIGYHKILNFCLKDGSFSPFSNRDAFGSMFLTTFVVKTLTMAKEFIYVDQRIIERAVAWIFSHQLENGCFDTMLHVFQDMGEANTENSTSAVSSYVIVSLIDAGITIPDAIVNDSKFCIRGYSNPDKYTLAISCYTLFKIKWYDEASKVLKRLLNLASKQNNMMWWTIKEAGSDALDIEITSYALLSLLTYNTKENLAHAHSVVRWLTTKVGPRGGFKSTQDTVVALDALSKYSTAISHRRINLDVQIQADRQHLSYRIQNDDRLKTKKVSLKSLNNDINVRIRGEGCLLVQSVVTYHLKNVPRSEAFKVALEVSPVSTVAKCSIATLSPCVSYSGPDNHSNMAVLDVSLPSGYVADRASLYKLTESGKSEIKMFEEINDRVVFYFTKLDKEMKCFSFGINENTFVEKRAKNTVKLFDYYKPEYENVEMYTLKNCSDPDDSDVTPTEIYTITNPTSTLSYWDYFDSSNETTQYDFETTTYYMKPEDYFNN